MILLLLGMMLLKSLNKGIPMQSFSDQGSWKSQISFEHRSSSIKESSKIAQRKYA